MKLRKADETEITEATEANETTESTGTAGSTGAAETTVTTATAAAAPAATADNGGWEPKIVAFLCNWCSYAGADLAGTGRIQYPHNIRIIRLPCSGRVNPLYIIKAIAEGADGVMVSGCHPGDCHYLSGNMFARRRFVILKRLLETAGIEPDRVQFTWISASEGVRFGAVVDEVVNKIRKLGPGKLAGICRQGHDAGYETSQGTQAIDAGMGCGQISRR